MKRTFRILAIELISLCSLLVLSSCQFGEMESQKLVNRAADLFEESKYDSSSKLLQQALDTDPNNAEALYWMSRIDMKYRDPKGAQTKLNQALGIEPENREFMRMLMLSHKSEAEERILNGEFEPAQGAYMACARVGEQIVSLDAYDALTHLERARCFLGAKEYDSAVEAYEASIRANPFLKSSDGTTEHYKELGEMYRRFGFFDKAIRVLNNGILNNLDDGVLETSVADVLMETGAYEEALAHYDRASKVMLESDSTRLRAMSAIYGAGMASYALARLDEKALRMREARDRYASARDWLTAYVEGALEPKDRLRRSSVVHLLKIIEAKLGEETI